LLAHITPFIIAFGYPGVFVWMFASACIPIPSEAVLPVAGAMIPTQHVFNVHLLALAGGLGNLGGSLLAYWIGAWKGRPFFEKYGKYVLIRRRDLDAGDRWFLKHGEATVFFTRMVPVIRAVISYPAGIARMPLRRFAVYSFIGGLIWCYILAYAGLALGEQWDKISGYIHKADAAVVAVILALAAIWLWRHIRPDAEPAANSEAPGEASTTEASL
jgi:membrane protein DedA with SNARE-associated domain